MTRNRLPDFLEHMQQAATDARSFVKGMGKDEFLADKRTQIRLAPATVLGATGWRGLSWQSP